jgi:hypothetical protein
MGGGRMIVNKPYLYWIYVMPSDKRNYPFAYKGQPLTKEEYLEHWGKWVIMDEREQLDELARKLEPYVESRAIYTIKYTRSPEPSFGLNTCFMGVFCDDREKEEVWQILSSLGVTLKLWVYDREIIEMWQPEGALMKMWLDAHKIDPESKEAEEIRRRTQQSYEKWLSYIGDEYAKGPWAFELIQ